MFTIFSIVLVKAVFDLQMAYDLKLITGRNLDSTTNLYGWSTTKATEKFLSAACLLAGTL